jgi:hypothetical protein
VFSLKIIFLGEQSDIIANGQDTLQGLAGIGVPALHVLTIRQPKCASDKRTLRPVSPARPVKLLLVVAPAIPAASASYQFNY